MCIKTFVVPLVAGTIFLCACKRDAVNLDYTNAKGEVPRLGNLVFRFNKSLVSDSVLNLWDSTEFISFEPEIPGRFRWESPDQLVFSPLQPLAGATTYKAKFNRELLRHSKYDKVEKADKMNFHTPDLSLDQSQVIWMLKDETSRAPVSQIDMYFNYRVNPDDLKDKLTIEVEGKKVSYSLHTLSAGNKISVRLMNLKAEDKDLEARVIIDKGLKPEQGNNKTIEPIMASISIPSPFVLSIQNVEAEHDGTEGTVRVMTSQQVSSENLKSFLKFNPGLNYNIQHDETGFIISSDKFDITQSYVLTILKGLRGNIGGTLKEDMTNSVAFGELEANINFTNNKAVYLSKHGGKNTEVRITNVPKVRMIISKIYESNLLMAQRYGYYPKESNEARYTSYEGDYEGDYYEERANEVMLGDVIYEKEIDTRSLPRSAGGRLLDFRQFEDRLPDFKGIYHVMIRSTKDYWVRDSRFISVSDIGIIAKEGQDKIFVFINSIKTSNAIDGVNVAVYGSNNQLVGAGVTNKDGVADVTFSKKEFTGFRAGMVIAKTDDDFNYLPFNSTKVNTSRFEVGGKRNNSTGMDAFIYPERDIYRPGEKVNFSVIIRDREWKIPGDIPVKMKFLMPNGRELKLFRKNLNEQGSLEGSVDIPIAAITGSYSLEVYTSNDVLLASKNFMIEEFVPDRIKVDAKLDKPFLRPGESANLHINAMNFFGPPASNRNYELDIQVNQKLFSAKDFDKFDFTITKKNISFDKIPVKEGKTDESGNAHEVFEVKPEYANSGLLQANLYATVFDETGRPVSKSATVDIFTQDVFYGIRRDWFYYYPLNQPIKFQLASLNKDGKVVNSTARVHIIKHEYFTHLVRSGEYFRYESQQNEKLMIENQITIGANTTYSYVPRSPGNYEIRVYRPGANSYVKREFYSYGSWGADNSSFEVNNEGHIEIEADKENYVSGDNVKLFFKCPFSGKMLVTVEKDKVLSYEYVTVEKRTASIDIKLTGDHLPNIYITATLIKPHEISDIPLTVAHGFQNIKVEEKKRKIPVDIVAQKTVRSRTHQKVKVKVVPGSYVTLSAVDNGVLQVSNFKTPDPYNYFYQKKALQVTAYDLYPLLFPEVRARLSSTGGDGVEMEKRVNPMPAKRIKIVSYWSGIAKADASGEANFEFDIPQFSGEIRLMAVAYKNESFGTGEKNVTVADPVVLSTALPRFLSPGDTITVPVTISNTTSKSANVSAVLNVTPPLRVIGNSNQSANIGSNSEESVSFRVAADPTINVARVSVAVTAMGEKFLDETEISVRPPSTLQKLTGYGSIAGGKSQRIDIGTSDFIPGSVNYQLVVSRSPVLEVAEHLSYLVQYPYGCTEQTISSAFPQLYYGDLADLMQLNRQMKLNANTNVLEAIRKLKMRQLYNGAVTLWDGEGTEDWWTTIYAAHFLLEAKKAGFDPDNSLIETMLGYITNRLKNKETIIYYYNRNQNKKIAPKEVAYSLYVLALAGRPQASSMNYYKSNPQILALDSKYLLSATYAIAGDKKSFTSIVPGSFSGEESVPQTGGSYYSYVRDEAIALNALIEVDPGNKQIPIMAKHVSGKLKERYYLSTQERAFTFLALGKLARMSNKSDVTADIKVNGKTIAKINGNNWRGDKNALKGTNVELITNGSGTLYYFWQAEGISATGKYKEEDNYIRVRRKFFDRYGREISGNTFTQNDLVIVGITLENAYSTDVENVVITDLLPAGFEIENPRTKEIPGMDWIKNASTPTSLDVRDDRIHFFVDLTTNKQMYYYAVRAVSPGQFRMGPVSADAMYNGEYHSYHGAGYIKVINR